jgi:DNA-binding IclR family transcriptional regulator
MFVEARSTMSDEHAEAILAYMRRDARGYFAIPQLVRYLGLTDTEVLTSLADLLRAGYVERRGPAVPLYTLTPAGIAAAKAP